MMQSRANPSNFVSRLSREKLLLLLSAAVECGNYRFLRQSALAWLTSYPGDLEVNLHLARSLMADGRKQQCIPMLEKLCRLDPEYEAAYVALLEAGKESGNDKSIRALGGLSVVSAKKISAINLPGWADVLRDGRTALAENQLDEAEKLVAEVLATDPDVPLAGILHTQVTKARGEAMTVVNLASAYHARWPDCLQIALLLAEAQLETGDEASAVSLLHRCVVNDAAGQVAVRLWGNNFAFRPLWPDPLEIAFDIQIPAEISARLGWNLLSAGNAVEPDVYRVVEPLQFEEDEMPYIPRQRVEMPAENEPVLPFIEALLAQEEAAVPEEMTEADGVVVGDEIQDGGANKAEMPESTVELTEIQPMPKYAKPALNETLKSVQDELERVAKRLKKPGAGRADGRYPVYVVFSTVKGLVQQYGVNTMDVLDKELQKLAQQVAKKPGWDALVFYPDSQTCVEKFGLKAIDDIDPWKLKLALADLDHALTKKGEMIAAVLIVGGSEVVPFHHLPNPTDDMDALIASDNPYATLDANYFVQDWPVGRLPGEAGPDAGLLLEQIRQITRAHHKANQGKGRSNVSDFWKRVSVFMAARAFQKRKGNFGYTAAVWQRSSVAVFRPIGEAQTLLASPPQSSGSLQRGKLNGTSLGYYNLHGLEDAPEWYGQRDTTDPTPGPDYPVAITPRDISGKNHSPQIVFSEACYGAHVEGKTADQSIALKFLSQGTEALVGSSAAAYGSVTLPLIGADLLGNFFWKNLKAGNPVGAALMQAKVDLVKEMMHRQGFLDGEDQKTLLSFILYGDPLTATGLNGQQHKTALRSHLRPTVKTICDRQEEGRPSIPVPGEVLKQVKAVVAEYLPGLESAELIVHHQYGACDGKGHHCPTSQIGAKNAQHNETGRTVVTIHKEVKIGPHRQQQYARVTLDQKGRLVKLALSR